MKLLIPVIFFLILTTQALAQTECATEKQTLRDQAQAGVPVSELLPLMERVFRCEQPSFPDAGDFLTPTPTLE